MGAHVYISRAGTRTRTNRRTHHQEAVDISKLKSLSYVRLSRGHVYARATRSTAGPTPRRFEPLRAEPNRFPAHLFNCSDASIWMRAGAAGAPHT